MNMSLLKSKGAQAYALLALFVEGMLWLAMSAAASKLFAFLIVSAFVQLFLWHILISSRSDATQVPPIWTTALGCPDRSPQHPRS